MNWSNWLPLVAVLFAAGALAEQAWLVFLASLLGALYLAGWAWSRLSLLKLTYSRRWHYLRGFPGEEIPVRMEVENRKRLPVAWLRVIDRMPFAIGPHESARLLSTNNPRIGLLVNLFSLRGREKISHRHTLVCRERGLFPVGPAELEAGDLFGLFPAKHEQKQWDYVTVFPEILPLSALHLPSEDPFGDRNAPRRLFEDPNRTIGVRGYRPEDEMRRIHWPATARTGELQVRVYQPVSARMLVVCLNVATSKENWWTTSTDAFEHLIKVAATVAYHATEDGYAVGLLSNGSLAGSDQPYHIQPGRSQNHLALLLEALAGIPAYTLRPFADYLTRSMPRVPLGATLVIITAQVSQDLVEALVQLKRYRAHITLISLDENPLPDVPGVRLIHLPYQPEGAAA
jgi:uncharacterized protein (DUF58 family)